MIDNMKTKLKILNLSITMKCSLNCQLCVADINKYDIPPHWDFDYLAKSMKNAFDIIDRAEKFQFSGGEPFMHNALDRLIAESMKYKHKFAYLGIFTNATIPVFDDVLKQMIKYKDNIIVFISKYQASGKANEIISTLSKHNIKYEVKDYSTELQHFGGWVDYGNYEYIERSEDELCEVFENCGAIKIGGIWSIRFGQLHRCTRSASGISLGKTNPYDYIDLMNGNRFDNRHMLELLIKKKYIEACRHCPGTFGTADKKKRCKAGIQ